MEPYGNMELDDHPYDSYASDDTSESDFDFDDDELADNLDELELSDDEDSDVYAEELNSMSESSITDSAFTSICLKELTPVSVFRNFVDEEIWQLITDQTNIDGKGKERSNHQKNEVTAEGCEQKRDWIVSWIGYSNGYQPLAKYETLLE